MTHPILNERSLLSACHQKRTTRWLPGWTRWTAAAVLALMALSGAPVFAGKGGKGTPGNDLPPMVAPFVEYQITWIAHDFSIQDVNKDGIAVGYSSFTNEAGERRWTGHIVNHLGASWDVEALFGPAIAALAPPEGPWESLAFGGINAQGQILGFLLHAGGPLDAMVALFDLHTGQVTPVDYYSGDIYFRSWDLNEAGDIVCGIRDTSQDPRPEFDYLYRFPYPSDPELIARLLDATGMHIYNLNGAGQMAVVASFLETVQVRKNRYEERSVWKQFLREVDGSFIQLGDHSSTNIGVSADGSVYGSTDGISDNGDDVFHRWDPVSGWEPLCQLGSSGLAVSKAPIGETEVVFGPTDDNRGIVYREGYGPYEIHVTSGLDGPGDVVLWNGDRWTRRYFERVSLPASLAADGTSAGFIAGRSSDYGNFILTPMPVAP